MSLREITAILFRQRTKALIALLLPPVAAVVLLLVLPPRYQADSDILVKTGREYLAETGGDAGLTAPTSTKQEGINSEIELLTSRTVVVATIQAIEVSKLYPKLVADPPWFGTLSDAAVKRFNRDLTVEPVKLSNIIHVSFDASSPAQAQRVLDRLIAIYIDKHTEVFAARRSDSYADAIQRDLAEIAGLERERTRIKLAGGIYDIATQRSALIAQRVAAQTHLQMAVDTMATLRHRLDTLTGERAVLPPALTSSVTERNDATTHARQGLVDLRATEAEMASRYAPENPSLQRVRSQIAALAQVAAAGIDRVNTTTATSPLVQQIDAELVMDRAELSPLLEEQARYQALLTALDQQLYSLEQADGDVRVTESRIGALNDDLKTAQSRYGQARTQEEMDQARQVSVVQVAPALSPDEAAKPKTLLFLAAGALLGLLGLSGVAIASLLASHTVVTEEAAERLLGLPVLLSLPLARRPDGPVTLQLD